MKIILEASPLVEDRMSGIGHATLELVRAIQKVPGFGEEFELILAVSYDRANNLERLGLQDVRRLLIPLPLRILNLVWKYRLLPPMDIFLPRGVYIFPNYKNWKLLASPSITYVHDIGFVLYPQFVSPKNQRFLAKNMPNWLKRTTIVAADSQSAKQEVQDYYNIPNEKVKVFYHGVDRSVFYPRSEDEVAAIKRKYAINGDYILYLGNIEPRKNIERIIGAYSLLSESQQKQYALVLVGGSGWLNESIDEAINQAMRKGLHIVRPSIFVVDEDLPALHTGATILLHPALYEGFGLSLVQAMACSTPVIAGNNSSMPEVIGEAGLLVDEKDELAISTTLGKLLQDESLRMKLAKKGLEQAKKFNWDETAKLLVEQARALKWRSPR